MTRIQGTGYGIGSVPSYKTTVKKSADSDKDQTNSSAVSKDESTEEKASAAMRSTDVYQKGSKMSAEDRQKIIDTLTGGGNGAAGISYNKDYGNVVGDVKLSDDAKKVYDTLKAKYHDMAFVLVSADQKDAVESNASRYGMAGKTTVLIDEEKLEKMATDPEYRKEIEAKIELGRINLQQMSEQMSQQSGDDNFLASYGMKFNDDGSTSYFATFDKAMAENREQMKQLDEKRQTQKAEEKRAEEKREAKKAEQKREAERAEKAEEEKKLDKEAAEKRADEVRDKPIDWDSGNYVTVTANSVDELMEKINAMIGGGSETPRAGMFFDASV